jgi:hypothetical protein
VRLLAASLLSAGCLLAQATPQLIFTKSFPGSVPAFESVVIDSTGALAYAESPSDPKPLQKATLKEEEAAELFVLARQLDYFKNPVESGLKVANTGKKTFRYVDENGKSSETTFNFSLNESAKALLDRMEQIAASERAYLDLDRSIHFDHLGVNDSLAEIEALWVHKQLAAPTQFIPLLERIAKHESFMHLVRERASRLKDEFLAPPPATTADKTK